MEQIVTSRILHDHVFDVTTRSGASVTVQAGGGPEGPGPMELMLVSLATCAQSTILDVLEKMRQPFDDVRVLVDGERAEKAPRAWTRVHLTYLVRGEAVPDRVARAVEITARACSASSMIARTSELTEEAIQIRSTDAASTRPLRREVLRPHQTLEELVVSGEDHPDAGWFAAFRGDEVIGTAGVFPESSPHGGSDASWRIRAMAVAEGVRGRGIGELLLDACLDHARRHGADHVWCSARVPAEDFYARAGFRPTGEEYEPAGLGPHVRMDLDLT